ncbi:MAG: hypothetical protein KGQ47_08830, partial [Hyphomicrobiales bacterium]|nr:hypothetical protein [Hyphomicrobiales bacterium]
RSPENQAPNKESHPIHPIQEVSGSALTARRQIRETEVLGGGQRGTPGCFLLNMTPISSGEIVSA